MIDGKVTMRIYLILILISSMVTFSANATSHPRVIWPFITEFEVPDTRPTNFGISSALDSDTIVMGSVFESLFIPPDSPEPGSVYIYQQETQIQWSLNKVIVADNSQNGDSFGRQVALSENLLVVSAPEERAVYIFEKNRGGLNNWGKLKRIDGESGPFELFGYILAISNDIIAVTEAK